MSIAFSLLLISVAIVPGLVILDGLVAQSLIAVLAASALAFVGISARAADVNFTAQVTRRLKLAAAVPAIWMVLQILPMPFSRMSHSIWINANEALDRDWWGHISIDIGTTIGALVFYLANIALIVVTVFAARDRRRAEIALFALTAVTTLTTIALLISKTGLVAGVSASEMNEILGAISSLGIILSLTAGVRAVERHESRPAEIGATGAQYPAGPCGMRCRIADLSRRPGRQRNIEPCPDRRVRSCRFCFDTSHSPGRPGELGAGDFHRNHDRRGRDDHSLALRFRPYALAFSAIRQRCVPRRNFGSAANIVGHGLARNRRGDLCAAFAYLPGARQLGHEPTVNCLGIRNRAGLAHDPVHDRRDGRAFHHAISWRACARTGFFLSGRRRGLHYHHSRLRPSAMQACCIPASPWSPTP